MYFASWVFRAREFAVAPVGLALVLTLSVVSFGESSQGLEREIGDGRFLNVLGSRIEFVLPLRYDDKIEYY